MTNCHGRIQLIVFGGAKPLISGQRRGPRPEAQRAESGVEFWVGAASPLPISLGVLGSDVSSPSGVLCVAPAARRFPCILEAPDSLSTNLLGAKFGGDGSLAPTSPLNPPMPTVLFRRVDQ